MMLFNRNDLGEQVTLSWNDLGQRLQNGLCISLSCVIPRLRDNSCVLGIDVDWHKPQARNDDSHQLPEETINEKKITCYTVYLREHAMNKFQTDPNYSALLLYISILIDRVFYFRYCAQDEQDISIYLLLNVFLKFADTDPFDVTEVNPDIFDIGRQFADEAELEEPKYNDKKVTFECFREFCHEESTRY